MRTKVFHEPLRGDGRRRDVFPLPAVKMDDPPSRPVCRSVLRRLHRRAAENKQINKAISALNSMFFGAGTNRLRNESCTLNDGQRHAQRLVVQQVKRLGPPPEDASGPGAICALRAASSSYVEPEPGTGDVVSMALPRLSLPSGKVAGVDLASGLQGHTKVMVEKFEDYMLQDSRFMGDACELAGEVKPYNDPNLGDRKCYLDFLGLLYTCGVLSFTQSCRGRVGAFCVSKKPKFVDGKKVERQRLVLDCRQVNLQFKAPPLTELGSLSALTELTLRPEQTLFVAGSDIKDCFYACNLPPGMQDFFCLSRDVSIEEAVRIAGGNAEYMQSFGRCGGFLSPCISVLSMGFNWSFFLVQALHEQSACRSLGIDRDASS